MAIWDKGAAQEAMHWRRELRAAGSSAIAGARPHRVTWGPGCWDSSALSARLPGGSVSLSRRQKGGALDIRTRDFLSCKRNASSESEHSVARRMRTRGPVMCPSSHGSTQTHKSRRHCGGDSVYICNKKTKHLLPNFRRIKQSLCNETLQQLARYKCRTKQTKKYWAPGGNN